MKVIIAGSRDIVDYNIVAKAIKLSGFDVTKVICGCARGVDTLGRTWAKRNGVDYVDYPGDWHDDEGNYDPQAGFKRNEQMGAIADALIAIHDGKSKGTKHMIKYARQQ